MITETTDSGVLNAQKVTKLRGDKQHRPQIFVSLALVSSLKVTQFRGGGLDHPWLGS